MHIASAHAQSIASFGWSWFRDPAVVAYITAGIYAATLLVLIMQTRLQTKALRHSEYLRCQADFTEIMRSLLTTTSHNRIYDQLAASGSRFSRWTLYNDSEKTAYGYLEVVYELIERFYVLKTEGWIPESEWRQWEAWLDDVRSNPLLADVFEDNQGMFDPRFEKLVKAYLPSTRTVSSHPTPSN